MTPTHGTNGTAAGDSPFDGEAIPEIKIPNRVLMGAGPSASYPESLRAMGANTLGHLDPEFIEIMNNVGVMIRRVFRTKNQVTGAISGTGTAGMEAALCNLIERGDHVLVCLSGYFSDRMRQMCERMGAVVHIVENPWGVAFQPAQIDEALGKIDNPKLIAIVNAETSTGAWNPVDQLAPIAQRHGALLVVDTVTSLGGCPVLVDEWQIDACFSGTQKCIGCPPGLSPVTFSNRAMEIIRARKTPVQSWYLDMSLVETYWGDSGTGGRAYHHTAPSNALFGLHEALRLTLLEGLENRWARHELHSRALMAGLQAMHIKPFAQEGHRLWQLNAVHVPEGIDDAKVRTRLLREFDIEISGGLGEFKGKVWRIGVMGCSAQRGNILLLLSALEDILADMGHPTQKGAATDAAQNIYHAHDNTHPTSSNGAATVAKEHGEEDDEGMGETIGAEDVARGVAHQ